MGGGILAEAGAAVAKDPAEVFARVQSGDPHALLTCAAEPRCTRTRGAGAAPSRKVYGPAAREWHSGKGALRDGPQALCLRTGDHHDLRVGGEPAGSTSMELHSAHR